MAVERGHGFFVFEYMINEDEIVKHTLLKKKRLEHLSDIASNLELPGDFVELGTWRGGSAFAFINNLNDKDRQCWLFDSFEGMPNPTKHDFIYRNGKNKPAKKYKNFGMPDDDRKTYRICKEKLAKLNYPKKNIHIIKGWFKNMFPKVKDSIKDIAVLHVDCDWYESVKLSLETFYDKVVDGGYIIFDDYGTWAGAKKAVDEFFENRNIKIKLHQIDQTGYWMNK